MPKFYCEYCDIYLTHSSPAGRRQHTSGRKHITAKVEYYQNLIRERGFQPPPFVGRGLPRPPVDLMGGMQAPTPMLMRPQMMVRPPYMPGPMRPPYAMNAVGPSLGPMTARAPYYRMPAPPPPAS